MDIVSLHNGKNLLMSTTPSLDEEEEARKNTSLESMHRDGSLSEELVRERFRQAAGAGDVETLGWIREHERDYRIYDAEWKDALKTAVARGQLGSVDYLCIMRPYNLKNDKDIYPYAFLAATHDHPEVLQYFRSRKGFRDFDDRLAACAQVNSSERVLEWMENEIGSDPRNKKRYEMDCMLLHIEKHENKEFFDRLRAGSSYDEDRIDEFCCHAARFDNIPVLKHFASISHRFSKKVAEAAAKGDGAEAFAWLINKQRGAVDFVSCRGIAEQSGGRGVLRVMSEFRRNQVLSRINHRIF